MFAVPIDDHDVSRSVIYRERPAFTAVTELRTTFSLDRFRVGGGQSCSGDDAAKVSGYFREHCSTEAICEQRLQRKINSSNARRAA